MADLTEAMQVFVVTQLARHMTPTQVADAVHEEFGIRISRQQAANYDPTKSWTQVDQKWRVLFEKERRRYYRVKKREIPVADRAFRVAELQAMFWDARASGNVRLAASILRQIAEEEGGAYEGRNRVPPAADTPADKARKIRDAVFQMDGATMGDG